MWKELGHEDICKAARPFSNQIMIVKKLIIICCTVICSTTGIKGFINNHIMLAPRKGLEINYPPIAASIVPSLLGCALLCSTNPCCIGATLNSTNESALICSTYDLQLFNFTIDMEHSTYLYFLTDKGKCIVFVMLSWSKEHQKYYFGIYIMHQ